MMDKHRFILDLIDYWHEDTAYLSFHRPTHPVWQILKKMSMEDRDEVIIAVLRHVLTDESWIFLVLFSIVDSKDLPDITPNEAEVDEGFVKMSFDHMRRMWLNWGVERGYLHADELENVPSLS